nr:hypothetical protein [Tanacetum cinerariifolium]
QYTRRARIAQYSALPPIADEPASPLRDVSQGKACPTDSGFEADQDRANIAKTSTLPYKSTSRVTSLSANEGSMQYKLDELMALCTSLQRQQSEMVSRFEAQELEINSLKARIKLLEDKDKGVAEHSGDDAPVKGRRLDEGEEVAKRVSDNTAEMVTVLTSIDVATVLASGVTEVPTSSGSIPTAGPPAVEVPTGSDVVPTAGLILATATMVTPYIRRKGKEKMTESETPKKKKIQKQMDIQMARQLEEEMERDAQRMNEYDTPKFIHRSGIQHWDGILRTVTESSLRRNLKLKDEEGISSLPDVELFENLTLMRYNISPNQKFAFQKDEPASPLRDVSQGKACLTDSGFEADQDRANIAKTSTLPYESTSRVTSLSANEGSMQYKLDELMALCTSLQRQQSEMVSRFEAQELEINSLKARIKLLDDKDKGVAEHSGDDAPVKGRRLDEGEEVAKRVSDNTAEMVTVLTSMDAATVLASGVTEVPTSSGSIPTAGPPAVEVPTGTTATVVTPYIRRKGKEKMIESETPKKKKIQEQMDIQMARQLEEEMERDA